VNPAAVQSRVNSGCPAGQAIRAIGQDGSVSCDVLLGGGDVTAVIAGAGLSGGGFFGNVDLAVQFSGSGSAPSAARSDHTHARDNAFNTSVGGRVMEQVTSGFGNTAVGALAARSLMSGSQNTAVGADTLSNALDASYNVAVGKSSLQDVETGTSNVSVGFNSLRYLSSGAENVGIGAFSLYCLGSTATCGPTPPTEAYGNAGLGQGALANLVSGTGNTAVGRRAGERLATGSNNLYLGNSGTPFESGVIRIGENNVHTAVGFAGIRGRQTTLNDAVNVVIDSSGHVGTISSSRRFKDDIQNLGDVGLKLHALRPVQFRYTAAYADGDRPVQYGLIAEEVETVMPGLVAYGSHGQPESVKYHVLPSLLLAEVQRLERERAAQAHELLAIKAELASLRTATSAPASTSASTTTAASRPH
jgi:trimeric autotransporter adhesin